MKINNSISPTWQLNFSSPQRVKASEEGLFKPITAKVSGALTDEYVEQIKACARKAAAEGTNMISSGYAAVRDAQMGKFISPDREKAISQVSVALSNRSRVWKYGENLLDMLGIPYTASVYKGARYTTSEIFNENGEMIAGYHSDNGGWTSVPTADESRFQYESNQIYREAYNVAKAELTAAQQTTTQRTQSDGTVGLDIKV